MDSEDRRGRGEMRALTRHYYDFLSRIAPEADEFAWLAGAAVVQASLDGHVCLPLFSKKDDEGPSLNIFYAEFCPDLSPPEVELWSEKLLGSGLFVAPGGRAPFVIDEGSSCLYLLRYWQYEQRLASELNNRAQGILPMEPENVKAAMETIFGPLQSTSSQIDCQVLAAGLSVYKRLSVISGGPGTGKTYTVARIMALLQLLAAPEKIKIAIAAPTGKAAGRLQESIKNACASLSIPQEIQDVVSSVKASTIHRLLGWRPNSSEFRYNREQQLALDLLIVDEASMVDLPLMTKLFEAMPAEGRVILLGDRNQLASVESGRVMADICGSSPGNNFTKKLSENLYLSGGIRMQPIDKKSENDVMADCVVILEKSYRFSESSAIGSLAGAVLAGDAQLAKRTFSLGKEVDCHPFISDEVGSLDRNFAKLILESYHDLAVSVEPEEAFLALGRFQVLCVYRSGIGGVRYMNRQIESILLLNGMIDGGLWYKGRPVIVSGNHYDLQLFNGDVGICLEVGGELRVFFPKVEGGCRSISPARIPLHETAYAITVHKSQGSEFEHVVLTLPEKYSPLISRELLYTAITRGKKRFTLWGSLDIWESGIQAVSQRQTGLAGLLY